MTEFLQTVFIILDYLLHIKEDVLNELEDKTDLATVSCVCSIDHQAGDLTGQAAGPLLVTPLACPSLKDICKTSR